MGFLNALRRTLSGERGLPGKDRAGEGELAAEWGYSDTSHPEFPDGRAPVADPAEMAAPPSTTGYDRDQWHKKLALILDKLPGSEDQWSDLMAEASALNLDRSWVEQCQIQEFTLLVRRVVSDQKVTFQEHRKLDQARSLIGLTEDQAITILNEVVADAKDFFGGEIEGA